MIMGQETESFWTDIKRYEDILDRDPGSYCFAPLSELYRKVGLLDDAIDTARKGIEVHPEYVGGYMALGRACFEKGEKAESREALERVVRVTPDNLLAQKLLSQLYIDAGDSDKARAALDIILSLNPDDLESKVSLDALIRSAERVFQPEEEFFPLEQPPASSPFVGEVADIEDESFFEEAEIVEELIDEVVAEEALPEDGPFGVSFVKEEPAEEEPPQDPLRTATIAELYVSQGFLKKALKIYRDLSDANPDNEELRNRLVALKHRIDEDEALARENALTTEMPFGEAAAGASFEPGVAGEVSGTVADTGVVTVLEGWLDNIGRIRECRSGRR